MRSPATKQVRPPLVKESLPDGSLIWADWDGNVVHRRPCSECSGAGGECDGKGCWDGWVDDFDHGCLDCERIDLLAMAAGLGRQA